MNVRFINPFVKSVCNTFETMCSLNVEIGKPELKTTGDPPNDVSGIIGFSGDAAGSVVLHYSFDVASKVATAFTGVDINPEHQDFSDAIGELTNMVAGGAKARFEGLKISISLPNVIVGESHTVSPSNNSPRLTIPCKTDAGPFQLEVGMVLVAEQADKTKGRNHKGKHVKILLVDDSRTIRNIQRNVLEQLGHTDITEAEDGVQALAKFQETAPDLLLIDWNMPNMNGITLVRKIRETNQTVPMIMCTTEAEKSRVLEAIKAGVNNYIVKPFSADSLGEKIEQTMAKAASPAG